MSPKTTDNPKDERIEVRLTAGISEKLSYCCKILGGTKSEIIREGIDRMYGAAEREEERSEANMDNEGLIEEAEKERHEMEYEKAYDEAYEKAYAEEYAKLIINPMYKTPSDAREAADDNAKYTAKEEAKEAVKDFWKS